ncbi:hypothetical protein B0H13DRAFT_2301139 [Mycena leptocephala]|nr:hypothetical protein B0H13DRAFT_2301139 [Mycena leptocephala]
MSDRSALEKRKRLREDFPLLNVTNLMILLPLLARRHLRICARKKKKRNLLNLATDSVDSIAIADEIAEWVDTVLDDAAPLEPVELGFLAEASLKKARNLKTSALLRPKATQVEPLQAHL